MRKISLLLIAITFLTSSLTSQTNYNSLEDSIRNIIATTNFDSVKIENYKILGYQIKTELDSSLFYLKKGLELSYNNYKEKCLFNNLMGGVYMRGNIIDSSIYYFDVVRKLAADKNDSLRLSSSYNNIGACFRKLKKYEKALFNFRQSLSYKNDNMTKTNIAILYEYMGYKLKAKREYEKVFNEMGNYVFSDSVLDADLHDFVFLSINYAILNKKEKEYIKAINILKKIKPIIYDKLNLREYKYQYHNNLGIYYQNLKILDTANIHILKAIEYSKFELDDNIIAKTNYVRLLIAKEDFRKAKIIVDELLLVTNDYDILENIYKFSVEINHYNKNYNGVWKFHNKLMEVIDSNIRKKQLEELADIETKYQTEKKEKEILLLSQQKLEQDKKIAEQNLANNNKQLLIYGLLGGLLVLIGGGYFIYNRKKLQQAKERAEVETEISQLEQKALKTQINTHFIFNAIDVAQGFIAKDNYQEARRCLVDVTRLVRLILENASETNVSLEDEISCLEAYLEVSQMLNKGKFTYQINVPMGIDESNVSLPPMLIQPFIENAIIHGALPNDELTSILINFDMKESVLTCVIQDDGVGREAKSGNKNPFKRKSMGMSITKDRIEKNNKSFGVDSTINFTDLIGEKLGTKVSFNIATTSVY